MHEQTRAYISTLGDQWLDINRNDIGKRDPVSDLIAQVKLPLGNVLEVGCCNGWRLKSLREKYNCGIFGIDPSQAAIKEADDPNIVGGTADRIPFNDLCFDTVIMGFCLYVIHPSEWFKVLAETDRVLKFNGHIIIYDFTSSRPFKRRLTNEFDNMFMYYNDWPKLWEISPMYKKIVEGHLYKRNEMVTVFRKCETDNLLLVD